MLSDSTLYLSAISPTDPNSPIADQTHSAMRRLGEILGMAGIDYPQVVSCDVQLSDMENYAAMDEVYGSDFPEVDFHAQHQAAGGIELEFVVVAEPMMLRPTRQSSAGRQAPRLTCPASPSYAGRTSCNEFPSGGLDHARLRWHRESEWGDRAARPQSEHSGCAQAR